MAINLLPKNPTLASNPNLSGLSSNINFDSSGQVSSAPAQRTAAGISTPIGVQAKTPNSTVSGPSTTLPKAQQQPLTSAPVSPVNPSTGLTNDQVLANSTAAAQSAANAIGGSYSPTSGYTAGTTQTGTQSGSTGTTGTSTATQTPSYQGYLAQLVSQNQSQPSAAVGTAVNTLQGTAATNPGASGAAYNQYTTDNAQYNKDLMAYNNTSNGLRTQAGIPLEFQTGREGAYQLLNGGRLQAEQAAVTNDLAGVGQNISGVQTQQAGANQAGGLANTQNSQQIGALGAAVSSTQPQLGSYGQTYYQPTQAGQTGTQGNLDPQTQAASLAQKVMSNQMTYDQAISSMGYAGSAGTTFLNNAITSAGGNPLSLQAQGTTQQGIISTQGQQVAGYQSALQQGQNLQSQLSDLITTFGLNPNDVNAVNAGLQKIAQNTSSPQYKILSNYVNDIANTYAQVLTPPGGSATDTTRGIATSMLDATASGQSLLTVMKSLDAAAQAKIAGVTTTGTNQSSGSSTASSLNDSSSWPGFN